MLSSEWKRTIRPWLPAAFCTLLSIITLYPHSETVGSGFVAFLCFLPMCFFGVGLVISEMRREISELRKHVAELQQRGKK